MDIQSLQKVLGLPWCILPVAHSRITLWNRPDNQSLRFPSKASYCPYLNFHWIPQTGSEDGGRPGIVQPVLESKVPHVVSRVEGSAEILPAHLRVLEACSSWREGRLQPVTFFAEIHYSLLLILLLFRREGWTHWCWSRSAPLLFLAERTLVAAGSASSAVPCCEWDDVQLSIEILCDDDVQEAGVHSGD